MKALFIILLTLLLGFHGMDKPIITDNGYITTITIGDEIYKSARSEIGEAWTDERKQY